MRVGGAGIMPGGEQGTEDEPARADEEACHSVGYNFRTVRADCIRARGRDNDYLFLILAADHLLNS